MYDVSFIISIDSSFEMTNNFFENFLNDNFVKNSQIIIVNDCVENIRIINYLKLIDKNFELQAKVFNRQAWNSRKVIK